MSPLVPFQVHSSFSIDRGTDRPELMPRAITPCRRGATSTAVSQLPTLPRSVHPVVLDGEGEASVPVLNVVHSGSGVAAAVVVVATVPAQNKKRAANRGNKDQVLSLAPSLLSCSIFYHV